MPKKQGDLIRSIVGEARLRDGAAGGDEPPTLFGHFAVFDQWTEIESPIEGHFMERMQRGAFTKTIAERGAQVKVLFDHGQDPQMGTKPLGPIRALEEDDHGVAYEVELIPTDYNRNFILPAAREGLLGASFQFRVIDEEWVDPIGRSDYNPKGIPEVTVREVALYEFGPVTFPAYAGATAAVRSDTDRYSVAARTTSRRPDVRRDTPEVPDFHVVRNKIELRVNTWLRTHPLREDIRC